MRRGVTQRGAALSAGLALGIGLATLPVQAADHATATAGGAPASTAGGAPASTAGGAPALTLDRIMADPDWIGPRVHDAYWSYDARAVYYSIKRSGSPVEDLHRIELGTRRDEVIGPRAMPAADGAPVYDAAGRHSTFVRNGDVFLRDVASGHLTQITRTARPNSSPQFAPDGRVSFRADQDWFIFDPLTGVTTPAAVLKLEKDPGEAPKPDDLRDLQLRIFSTLKKLHDDKEALRRHADELQQNDPSRSALPFYLGENVTVVDTSLSPNLRWLIVVTAPKAAAPGFEGKLTRYVTESGYEEFEKERVRVGRNPPARQSLLLLDLEAHTTHALKADVLPGIHEDPLKAIRDENHTDAPSDAADAAAGDGAPAAGGGGKGSAEGGDTASSEAGEKGSAEGGDKKANNESRDGPRVRTADTLRGVLYKPADPDQGAGGFAWSRDGLEVAVQAYAIDNKDRWLATVDFEHHALVPQHRLTDPAWINWSTNEFGWLNDNRTLWYQSEESGFAHLYLKVPGEPARALTSGRFEVSHPVLSADGRWVYVLANVEAPYAYDVYRVPTGGGALTRITGFKGVEDFALAHGDAQLLVTHSSSYIPPQIAVVRADGSGAPRELTDTRTPEYRAIVWIAPEIVQVPSSHGAGAIYAKVYRAPPTPGGPPAAKPAVVFVHGAGYTQDVHLRFPYYFREQMFANLLVSQGYAVIDLDYRASRGYGRDWRVAIYRQMGHPELEDILDGKAWLIEHAGADPQRFGIYGGSYGGFMTLMALFRAPGEFKAGAALRPVTDWSQYDDGYSSDILNDPEIDPIAYRRSSPIEFADGLEDALLICHGVIDDNVLFDDSMRLYQRLIELHKDNFTISPYPLDRHGFTNADSWLDEYKRIDRLFEEHLKR